MRAARLVFGSVHTCGLNENGAPVCWGRNDNDQATPPPDERFSAISSGGFHTCGIRLDGTAVCWGLNDDGQASAPQPAA